MSTTRVLRVDPERPDASAIGEAARVLRAGGLVAFPTETVYGLGGRALEADAARRIFAAKGRPATHPLIAHVLDESWAREITSSFGPLSAKLASRFWPGPLTLVLDRAAHVPREVAGGGDTLAVRAPMHPVARALVEALGEPIAAPSANRYQTISPTTAAHVVKSLDGAVDLVLDGGSCARGIESTVVDARGDEVLVLRPGALDLPTLRAALPGVCVRLASLESDAGAGLAVGAVSDSLPRASPGMDARHYAPKARLEIVRGAAAARSRARELASRGQRVGLLSLEKKRSIEASPAAAHEAAADPSLLVRALPGAPAGYEAELFAALHELDDRACAVVVVEEPPDEEPWLAARDRLGRASAP